MAEAARAEMGASFRRDAILEAVAHAAESLLLTPDWRDAAQDVLARLGLAAGVSRAYVIQNHLDLEGRARCRQLVEWCQPGVASQMGNPALDDSPWDEIGFARWVEVMSSGGSIVGRVDDLPRTERSVLREQDIASLASIPIFVDGTWWGLIGFDDCVNTRDWAGGELDALRAAASVLGAAIQRHLTDAEASEAKARAQRIIERIPAITYTEVPADDGLVIQFVSPQVTSILGYAPRAFIDDRKLRTSLIHPDDLECLLIGGAFDPVDRTEFDEEYRVLASDGRWVWLHDTSTAVLDGDGNVEYFLGFATDVTGHHETEDDLRATEERFRLIVEQTQGITYQELLQDGVYDPDCVVSYVSPRVRALVGYSPEEWDEPGWWSRIIHPDDIQAVLRESERVLAAADTTYTQEYRVIAKDGRTLWFHDESSLITDEDGNPKLWQGVMVDITERKESEQRAIEAQERLQALIDHMPAAVYIESPDSDPAKFYVSPQVREMLGYDPEEWTSTPHFWANSIHPDDRQETLAADARSEVTHESYSMEYRFKRSDGLYVWVHDEATFLPDPGGQGFWQGFMFDITARKEGEARLERALMVEREASERLRSLDEMKNTFLQAVSHDLRTPLAAILGLAITLERRDVRLDEDDARDLAGRIARNARRLDRLVANLLDLDRLARGIVAPKLQPTDVGALVRRVLAEAEVVADSRVRTEIEPVVISIDGAKVERIVENLVSNTARHAPPNATIWVSVHPADGGVLLMVEDDGPGVDPDLRGVIFQPFRQGPDNPRHSPGVGVGLTLVKRFTELHSGRVWVEEREGGGASFRVFLPAVPPEQS